MKVRERLQPYGAEKNLSDAEIITALLGKETRLSIADVSARNFEGLTATQKTIIRAALELSARVVALKNGAPQITSSQDAFRAVAPFLCNLEMERFCVVLLNRASKVIKVETLSSGGVAGTVVDMAAIARIAVSNTASAVIIAHNHPSGNCKPSPADTQVTQRAKAALGLMDITLLDHLIYCGENSYYSFMDNEQI